MSSRNQNTNTAWGVVFVILLNIIIEILTFKFKVASLFGGSRAHFSHIKTLAHAFTYIGLFQFLYVIPLVFFLILLQRLEFMKGVIIGAAITALLNGSCNLILGIPLLPVR